VARDGKSCPIVMRRAISWQNLAVDVHVSARDLAGNERPPARTAFSGDDGTDDEMTIL
jgi:hypothetical protein